MVYVKGHNRVKAKQNQYELYTSRQSPNDMPYQVFGKNLSDVRRNVFKKLRKGEKIISIKRCFW